MKHLVPATIDRPGCYAMSACRHCGCFGAKDGAEGCKGKAGLDAALARVEQYLREHPPQLVCLFGVGESVDEKGFKVTFQDLSEHRGPVFLGNDPATCSHIYPITRAGQCQGCGAVRRESL